MGRNARSARRHRAARASRSAWARSGRRAAAGPPPSGGNTINELPIALTRRAAPVALDKLTLTAPDVGDGLVLHFGEVGEPGHRDHVLIARGPAGAVFAVPQAEQLFQAGEAFGDGTVIFAGPLADAVTDANGVQRYVDSSADGTQNYDYIAYPLTAIGIYGSAVTAGRSP